MEEKSRSRIEKGTLYVVATPIGNMEDITLRALSVLRQVDEVAAEDTRHSGRLLKHHGISTKLTAFHDHNEARRVPALLDKLSGGFSLALLSDAGTPLVSDPGFKLVTAAVDAGIPVVPIPGASAPMAGLSVSGLACDAFSFFGFLDKKKARRRQRLEGLADDPNTLIFFESPHRISGLVDDLIQALGNRRAVLCREMTKIHEEFLRGDLKDLKEILAARGEVKGECTLLVEGGKTADPEKDLDLAALIRAELKHPEATVSGVAKRLALTHGIPKKIVYEKALEIKRENNRLPE